MITVIFGPQGATFFLNFHPSVLCAMCAYYVDKMQYVSTYFVNAKNNVDINSVSFVIKAFTNTSDSDWLSMSVRMHPCSMKPSWPLYGGVKFLWFLCFGGLSDCRICDDCTFYLNSKRTVCTAVFWCLCCSLSVSVSPKCTFLPASESDLIFSVCFFFFSLPVSMFCQRCLRLG